MRFFAFIFLCCMSATAAENGSMKKNEEAGCGSYRFDVSAPLAALKLEPISSPASSVPYFGVPEMKEGRWVELFLHTQDDEQGIEWLVKPQASGGFKGRYGGIASFTPKSDGKYFVAANGKMWVDFVDAEKKTVVPAGSYEMQPDCKEVFKVVKDYQLQAGRRYLLQIFSAPSESAKLYVGPQTQVTK